MHNPSSEEKRILAEIQKEYVALHGYDRQQAELMSHNLAEHDTFGPLLVALIRVMDRRMNDIAKHRIWMSHR